MKVKGGGGERENIKKKQKVTTEKANADVQKNSNAWVIERGQSGDASLRRR